MTPNQLWNRAAGDRDRYLRLLREYGYIYEREDGVTVHTEKNPQLTKTRLFDLRAEGAG